jgi:hypothetical protein
MQVAARTAVMVGTCNFNDDADAVRRSYNEMLLIVHIYTRTSILHCCFTVAPLCSYFMYSTCPLVLSVFLCATKRLFLCTPMCSYDRTTLVCAPIRTFSYFVFRCSPIRSFVLICFYMLTGLLLSVRLSAPKCSYMWSSILLYSHLLPCTPM